jgi:P4 family phage/plasmid primase-like protien
MELVQQLQKHGFEIDTLEIDSTFHDIKGIKKGWYIGHEVKTKKGPKVVISAGDWRTGETYKITSGELDKLTKKEIERVKKEATEAREKAHLQAAEIQKDIFSQASPQNGVIHPYLVKKSIDSMYTARNRKTRSGYDLLVPLYDIEDNFWCYQKITEDGSKDFMPGSKTKECFFTIGTIEPDGVVYICEGFATACSVHQATKAAVVAAFYASNLEPVSCAIRKRYPDVTIIIAADNDCWNEASGINAGIDYAKKCSVHTTSYVAPGFNEKHSEHKPTDWNDLHMLEGIKEVESQLKAHRPVDPRDLIPTEKTGFHTCEYVQGREKYEPQPKDLWKFFCRHHDYTAANGEVFYIYNGTHFEEWSDSRIKAFAQKHYNPACDNKKASEFLGLMGRQNFSDHRWFDLSTHRKINFQNGILEIDSGKFLPHSKDHGFRYCLPFDRDPDAKCPRFDKLMEDVTCGDQELQQALLEYGGYALSGDDCWLHKALILEGEGSNGKSTFLQVLRDLAGFDNYTSQSLKSLSKQFNIAQLDGKLFNVSEETPSKKVMDDDLFKRLVSGDDVVGEFKFKSPFKFRNKAKLIFACNELPHTKDVSDGYFRRLLIVPFNAKFTENDPGFDPHISKKLRDELPGIFNRFYASYKEMRARGGVIEPKASQEALKSYKDDSNPTEVWINDCLSAQKDSKCSIQAAFTAYREAMDREGVEKYKLVDLANFSKMVRKSFGVFTKKISEGGKRERCFVGLVLDSGDDF